jgi:acetyltransferase-like isoleucine patch superfamily enzyme
VTSRELRELARKLRLYQRKSRFVNENARPWVRAAVHWEFLRRESHITWPFYGPILPAIREGRLQIAPRVTVLPGVWITVPGEGRLSIGQGTWVNMGVMLAAYEHVEIGESCLFANNCFVTDADHAFDDPSIGVYQQGYNLKGPTKIGNNVWCGVNVAVLGGVTIGDGCVIGSNSVVTSDLEPHSVAVGIPARTIRQIGAPG